MQTCLIDGVPTYTDRTDVCDESQPLKPGGGTLSVIDAWVSPQREKPAPAAVTPPPQRIIVEHYIEQPVYLQQAQPLVYSPIYQQRLEHRHTNYSKRSTYSPPSLYRHRVKHTMLPHQRKPFFNKHHQSGRNPASHPTVKMHQRHQPSSRTMGSAGYGG